MALDRRHLRHMEALLAAGGPPLIRRLRHTDPSQLAEWIPALSARGQLSLLRHLDSGRAAALLGFLDLGTQVQVMQALPAHKAVRILEHMEPDDSADLLAELSPARSEHLLALMEQAEAKQIRELLAYPPDTAGGLMTPEYVSLSADLTVGEAMDALRRHAPEAETIYYVYVVDDARRLLGVVSLRELLIADLATPIRDVMRTHLETVTVDEHEEDVARKVARFDLLAVPVVDHEGRICGVVTVDDIVDVLEEARVAQLLERVGSRALELERKRPWQVAQMRLPWLLTTIGIELIAAIIVHYFDGTLQRFILLASFMPVISAVSGNVGLQSAAITVRGLETRHIRADSWLRPVLRELQTDVLVGLVAGGALALIAGFWAHRLGMGLIVGLSTAVAMATAGVMGSVFPLVTHSLGFDPAVTAGPFETSFQDVVGFLVFLGLATWLAGWLG